MVSDFTGIWLSPHRLDEKILKLLKPKNEQPYCRQFIKRNINCSLNQEKKSIKIIKNVVIWCWVENSKIYNFESICSPVLTLVYRLLWMQFWAHLCHQVAEYVAYWNIMSQQAGRRVRALQFSEREKWERNSEREKWERNSERERSERGILR